MHQQWLKKGHPKLSKELADEIRANARPPKRTVRKMLRVPFLYIRQAIQRRRKQRPQPLDEFGFPIAWRHEEPQRETRSVQYLWGPFELWSNERGSRPIPASPESVIAYLREIDGPARQDAYEAIAYKHEKVYWHTGACPHCILKLGYGLKVLADGELVVAPQKEQEFRTRFG